jgi:DNA invertase Pin-like site-specific DNA recombinase
LDNMSGALDHRSGLADLMAFVREGYIVLVWRLDRVGHNMLAQPAEV